MSDTELKRVLFVCMGNICRSPTAEGVFRELLSRHSLAEQVETDSAGTHGYHVGNPPDPRAQQEARARGMDISDLRARQFTVTDFQYFDWIIAMDQANLEILLAECPDARRGRVRLLMEFARDSGIREVPDPYYGGDDGFRQVFDMVEQGCAGLLEALGKGH